MDVPVGDDLTLGWGWIRVSRYDLRHRDLYLDGRESPRSGPAMLRLALLPADICPADRGSPIRG